MQRFTISLEDDLAEEFSKWSARHQYENRSEAIRDLIRERLAQESLMREINPHCVGVVTYTYDHHERELSKRLTHQQHQHHDLTVAALHVHLDESECLEVCVLRGPVKSVTAQADTLLAERGVNHGNVHVVPSRTKKMLLLR